MKSKLKYISLIFVVVDVAVAAGTALLAACGGGGADAPTNTQPTPGVAASPTPAASPPTGIAGAAGSSCATTASPQQAIYDLDKAGYTAYFMIRVDCKLADGTKQNIAGLPLSAFKLNGNGEYGPGTANATKTDVAPESMVTGTSALDGGATYVLQVYRKLAAPVTFVARPGDTPVVRVTGFGAETISIVGQDGQGRSITAVASNVQGGGANGVDDLDGGVMSGASRSIDPDGMGFKATYFVTAIAFQAGVTSPACPAGNVKEFASVSLNNFGTKVDRRYCMYTDLSASNFGVKFAGKTKVVNGFTILDSITLDFGPGSWSWRHGADAGTLLSSFTIDAATLQSQTVAANRTPIYKLDFSVRYPKKATPNFAAVSDPSVYSLAFTVPQFPSSGFAAWPINNVTSGGTQWNDLPAR